MQWGAYKVPRICVNFEGIIFRTRQKSVKIFVVFADHQVEYSVS